MHLAMSDEGRPKIDLDLAAAEIESRRARWTAAGFEVGELTWRDVAAGWPYPLVGRADATSPDSVGVRAVRGEVEFSVVLFDGGWADVEGGHLDAGGYEAEAPDVADAQAFGSLLDRTFDRWTST